MEIQNNKNKSRGSSDVFIQSLKWYHVSLYKIVFSYIVAWWENNCQAKTIAKVNGWKKKQKSNRSGSSRYSTLGVQMFE